MFSDINNKNLINSINGKLEFQKYDSDTRLEGITEFSESSFQKIVANYMNPNTPYKNLMLFWSTGSGKTYGSLTIAEQYNEYIGMLHKLNFEPKPYIYVVNKTIFGKIQFIKSLINPAFTHYKYVSKKIWKEFKDLEAEFKTKLTFEAQEKFTAYSKQLYKTTLTPNNNCFYKFITYQSMRKWLNKNVSFDYSNSMFIFDEAHDIEGNMEEKVIMRIKNESENNRFILVSATPIRSNTSQIIPLLNILRPLSEQLQPSKFFNPDMKEGAEKEIGKLSRGYISYVKIFNEDYPERIDMGNLYSKFKFLKLIRCPTSTTHQKFVLNYVKSLGIKELKDANSIKLQKKIIANIDFFLPIGEGYFYSQGAMEKLRKTKEGRTIQFTRETNPPTLIDPRFLHISKLKTYSPKIWTMFDGILERMESNSGLILISHSSIFKGVLLIKNILKVNGFLEYDSDRVNDSTRCFQCGKEHSKHPKNADHDFSPAKFAVLHGEINNYERELILQFFTSPDNIYGKNIKIIVGSSIITESVDFICLREIHSLQIQHSLNMDEQLVGRGIRFQSHNRLPKAERNVRVFRYISDFPILKDYFGEKIYNFEENSYLTQEKKFEEIQKVEYEIKVNAFDCQLNKYINISKVLLDKYRHCDKNCPILCNLTHCNYKCIFSDIPSRPSTETYDIIERKHDIQTFKQIIKYIMRYSLSISIPHILDEINIIMAQYYHGFVKYIDNNYIFEAIEDLTNQSEELTNIFGTIGTLKYKGGILRFIPGRTDSENIQMLYPISFSNSLNFSTSYNELKNAKFNENIDTTISILLSDESKFKESFEMLEHDEQVKIIEYAIEENKKELLTTLYKYFSKILITVDYLISNAKSFTVKTKSDNIKGNKVVGHLLSSKFKCYSSGEWGSCKNLINYKMPKFKVPEIVGFIDINNIGKMEFKIWQKNDTDVVDNRKKNKGQACITLKPNIIFDKVVPFLKIKEKDLTITENSPKKEICHFLKNKFKEMDEKQETYKYFFNYVELILARELHVIHF